VSFFSDAIVILLVFALVESIEYMILTLTRHLYAMSKTNSGTK